MDFAYIWQIYERNPIPHISRGINSYSDRNRVLCQLSFHCDHLPKIGPWGLVTEPIEMLPGDSWNLLSTAHS